MNYTFSENFSFPSLFAIPANELKCLSDSNFFRSLLVKHQNHRTGVPGDGFMGRTKNNLFSGNPKKMVIYP